MLKDRLGRPYKVGDTVLTNYHQSATMGQIAKIVKVNESTITLAFNYRIWRANYSPEGKYLGTKAVDRTTIRRYPHQVIVVTEQLAYNKSTYPEYLI